MSRTTRPDLTQLPAAYRDAAARGVRVYGIARFASVMLAGDIRTRD